MAALSVAATAGRAHSTCRGSFCPRSVPISPFRNAHRVIWSRAASAEHPASYSDADVSGQPSLDHQAASLKATIADLDALLGIEATVAEDAAAAATAAALVEAVAGEPDWAPPAHWAHLPPRELVRRRRLMRRRDQLLAKAAALQEAVKQQERKASYERQRLADLREEARSVAAQQRMLDDAIDPEAALQAQMAAAQARAAEMEADRRELQKFAVGFWFLFALLTVGHNMAPDWGYQLQEMWLDLTFM